MENGMLEISSTGICLVKFGATWCSPCKMLKKTLDSILPEFPEIQSQDVDVDDYPELSKEYKIKSVPTVILFKDGVESQRIVGSVRAEALRSTLREAI
jgi:thioredoxin 1